MTESGKTTLAKRLALEHRRKGRKVICLDPIFDPEWPADYLTDRPGEFLQCVKQSTGCAVFIDESGEMIGQYNDQMFWLATRARHYGHKSHFIVQRPAMISPTIRGQCSHLFLFNVSSDDAKILANEFNRDEIKKAHTLKQFEYYYCGRFGNLSKSRIKPLTRRVKHDPNIVSRNSADRGGGGLAGDGEGETEKWAET